MVSKNLAVYIIYGSIFKFINPSNPYNPVHSRPIFFLSALSSQPSALSPLPSALSPQPSALSPRSAENLWTRTALPR